MKRTVWSWRANIVDYIGKPNVVGIWLSSVFVNDSGLLGRDGYVGHIEIVEEKHEDIPDQSSTNN